MKKNNKVNQHITVLIKDLKKSAFDNGAPIWRDVADRFTKPSNNWAEVNISRIARHAKKGETLLIAGKLLGSGDIDASVTVAAFKASASAVTKITGAGGRVITIKELVAENPKGTGVRIMG